MADPRAGKLGFIGLGSMGGPMARRLLNAGLSLSVYDADGRRAQDVVLHGAQACESAAELAKRAGLIFVVVVDADQVGSVLFGPAGVAETASPGDCVVIFSTIGPAAMRRIGADDTALSMSRRYLNILGSKIVRCSTSPGRAQEVKLINQLLCGVHIAAA